ncbi:hypothetical protein A3F28_00880 [Candidatus Uhrbacteria bacterium RIFCSPHIGHO2_12_FULL_57_11]|uniref:NlpC/P60 domain-containing protein n=2 Tax=Candidatus Uhriibacteriota TaxID=1752732 RepID=A0A1F7UGH2_9BACT|nr:MAG: hypothetical protein A3D72_01635 [Candidatus Uhrbacteria bacterium RIFCSPHIGHO2_02_FULL_57_19]OGL77380.1 MAG: hypothetical protein A3F28_00880 [Candidatus Uhrbacteria bacterium RIFCSPHIGHO2_12_FULL_57_11]
MKTKRIVVGILTVLAFIGAAPPASAGCCVEWPIGSPGLKYCRQQGPEREGACSGDGRSWSDEDCNARAECSDAGKCQYGDNKSQCADERRWQCGQRGGVANVDFFPNQTCAAPAQAGFCCVTRAGDTTVCYDASTFPKVEDQTACESRGDVVRYESKVCTSVVECSQASPAAPAREEGLPLPAFIPAIPQLIIPIPGFKGFSEIKVTEAGQTRTLDIPFIAQYIQAIYNYVLGIVGIIATVMIVYGGIRWLTAAGNMTTIGDAKKMITNAVVGVIIALGSYLILFTINPELVRLRSLRLELIEQALLNELLTTTEPTIIEEVGGVPVDRPEEGARGPVEKVTPMATALVTSGLSDLLGQVANAQETDEAPTPTPGGCPFTFVNPYTPNLGRHPELHPRNLEFKEKVNELLTGITSKRERVVKIAELAAKCEMKLGACGNVTKTINQIAGDTSKTGQGTQTNGVGGDRVRFLKQINCSTRNPDRPPGCVRNPTAARRAAYAKFKTELADWPDSWANDLQAGDSFAIFNAQPGLAGQHAAIFMGWANEARGIAKVIQGQATPPSAVRTGTICLKKACNPNFSLTFTFSIE